MRPLIDLVGDAKVVGLGKSTHGAAELFTMKHRLIEFLVTELGFTACAFEASHAGSQPIDEYVRRGLGDPAAALTGQGYIAWDNVEVAALLGWLRNHNAGVEQKRRVAFWGLDTGYNSAGRRIVTDYLQRTAPDLQSSAERAFSLLDQLEPKWPFQLNDPSYEPTLLQAHAILEDLHRRIATDDGQPADPAELTQIRRCLRMMRHWTGPHRNDRSRHMGENLLDLMDQDPDVRKVVVWAHNRHIGHRTDAPKPNLADLLTERYGAAYVALALEFGSGSYHMRTVGSDLASAGLVEVVADIPAASSLPGYLAATGHEALAVSLRDRQPDPIMAEWMSRPQTEHEIGWTSANWSTFERQTLLAEKYDGVIYVDTVSPSHPTTNARQAIARHQRY